jgi:hypothetical protein
MTFAEGRMTLKRVLEALGYTPEGGFPDGDGEVPPAVVGTIEDLSSPRRLDLILQTQTELMNGRAARDAGRDAMRFFPAWELIRVAGRLEPRDWFRRFEEAGGTILVDGNGRRRLVAHKNDPVWDALGDSALFEDALDVDHPPFAFQSGMGWRNVPRSEWRELGGEMKEEGGRKKDEGALPENVATFKDAGSVDRLRKLYDQIDTDGLKVRARKLKETERRSDRAAYAARYGLTDEEVGL